MTKEVISRLIHSSDYRDVEIGIELSMKLDFKDFDEIFQEDINIKRDGNLWYVFGRKNKEIHITLNIICVYNTANLKEEWYSNDPWVFKGYQNY